MSKKEWYNLRIGSRVEVKLPDIDWDAEPPKLVDTILQGTVTKFNSNSSQVIIKWDERDYENWYGRLSLKLLSNESNTG